MTQIVLFHSGLGLRPSVGRWRRALQALGHQVLTPDLYDGEVFDDLQRGVQKRDAIGIQGLSERSNAAVAELPAEVIYAGFSLGAASAQALALTRPGALGLIMMHAVLPLEPFGRFGDTAWPDGLRAQFHAAVDDPWVDRSVLTAVSTAAGETLESFDYPGGAHLFADEDYADYDQASADLMFERVKTFIASVAQ